jgi:molybdopterin-guanine dinucleotide biosynthesis protein A
MKVREHSVGILLAGGKSSRMGGGDKCLLPLAGRPILAHVIERLKPQVAELIISANGEPTRFGLRLAGCRRSARGLCRASCRHSCRT